MKKVVKKRSTMPKIRTKAGRYGTCKYCGTYFAKSCSDCYWVSTRYDDSKLCDYVVCTKPLPKAIEDTYSIDKEIHDFSAAEKCCYFECKRKKDD